MKELTEYQKKLLDPRWQKKRLEILQRDNFACRCCEDEKSTLHVHHLDYQRGKEPWDYENDDLITLCEYCHEVWTYIYKTDFATEIISSIIRLHDNLEWQDIQKSINARESLELQNVYQD
jgi:hypothetical protein